MVKFSKHNMLKYALSSVALVALMGCHLAGEIKEGSQHVSKNVAKNTKAMFTEVPDPEKIYHQETRRPLEQNSQAWTQHHFDNEQPKKPYPHSNPAVYQMPEYETHYEPMSFEYEAIDRGVSADDLSQIEVVENFNAGDGSEPVMSQNYNNAGYDMTKRRPLNNDGFPLQQYAPSKENVVNRRVQADEGGVFYFNGSQDTNGSFIAIGPSGKDSTSEQATIEDFPSLNNIPEESAQFDKKQQLQKEMDQMLSQTNQVEASSSNEQLATRRPSANPPSTVPIISIEDFEAQKIADEVPSLPMVAAVMEEQPWHSEQEVGEPAPQIEAVSVAQIQAPPLQMQDSFTAQVQEALNDTQASDIADMEPAYISSADNTPVSVMPPPIASVVSANEAFMPELEVADIVGLDTPEQSQTKLIPGPKPPVVSPMVNPANRSYGGFLPQSRYAQRRRSNQ